MTGEVAGVVSDAEKAIADLNRAAGPESMPLARLPLRTESIASSKVEGMQLDARSLARAEANQETGRKVGSGAAEILANIDAMQLSIERAADLEETTPTDVLDIHRVLMERAPNAHNDVALPPLVQAAIAHAQFETIHPFADGNGRTGRALVQVVLRRRGLTPAFVPPISVVLARDKDRYLKAVARAPASTREPAG